jgi:hypothetical protein
VSIIVAGLYLLSLGLITLFARLLGFPYDRIATMIIGIFAVFLLCAVLISGKAKKRLRTFLGENFYLSRYNYRKEWRRYAEIMTSGATIDEFLSNVISSLCDTMLVRRGVIWADIGTGRAGSFGFDEEKLDAELIRDIQKLTTREPVVVFKNRSTPSRARTEDGSAPSRGSPRGRRTAASSFSAKRTSAAHTRRRTRTSSRRSRSRRSSPSTTSSWRSASSRRGRWIRSTASPRS